MKIVIATNNRGKLSEISEILKKLGAEAISQSEAGIHSEPPETGTTFEENALIKAKAACIASKMPAIADDSGLEVTALHGAPGVYSHRWCEGSDADKVRFLFKQMEGKTDRTARFVCCAACVFPNGESIVVRGECYGTITNKICGENGFGYDPVFYTEKYKKTFAEITAEQKNEISHRGVAFRLLAEKLGEKL